MQNGAAGFLLLVIFIIVIILSPYILISSINILLDSGGWQNEIEHELWTYFACYGLILTLRGGK